MNFEDLVYVTGHCIGPFLRCFFFGMSLRVIFEGIQLLDHHRDLPQPWTLYYLWLNAQIENSKLERTLTKVCIMYVMYNEGKNEWKQD